MYDEDKREGLDNMEKKKIDIGSFITSKTVHQTHASGHVTAILTNTIVIIDNEKQTHLIEKKTLKSNGYSISKKRFCCKVEK